MESTKEVLSVRIYTSWQQICHHLNSEISKSGKLSNEEFQVVTNNTISSITTSVSITTDHYQQEIMVNWTGCLITFLEL